MGKTISCSAGTVAINHNRRAYKTKEDIPKNIKPDMMQHNIYIQTCDNARKAFNDFFKDSVDEYNSRQSRDDRKKKDYYTELQASKNGETAIYEYVFQIGNKDDTPCQSEAGMECRDILMQYAKSFGEENPNFHVISSCIHMDEATPHLHITFIPWAKDYKNGLKMRCSTSRALESMDYTGEKRNMRSWKQAQEEKIEAIMLEHNMERVRLDTKREHVEVAVYKELKDMAVADATTEFENQFEQKIKEMAKNEAVIQEQAEKIAMQEKTLNAVHKKLDVRKGALEQIESAIQLGVEKASEAVERNQKLKDEAETYWDYKIALEGEIKLKTDELNTLNDAILRLEDKKDVLELQDLNLFKKFLEVFPSIKKQFEEFKEKITKEIKQRASERHIQHEAGKQSKADWLKQITRHSSGVSKNQGQGFGKSGVRPDNRENNGKDELS